MNKFREWANGQNKIVLVVAALITAVIMVVAVANAGSNNQAEAEEKPKEDTGEDKNPIIEFVEDKAMSDYGAKLSEIEVNHDAGTGEGYIVLINFSKLGKESKSDKLYDDLVTYSNDIAFHMSEHDEVNQVVAFWDISNIDSDGNALKRAYVRDDNGEMQLTDEQKDVNIFK